MDSERASRHWTDAIETELRGRRILLSVQSQHVPCKAYCAAGGRTCKEGLFVMTSKHVVDQLVLSCETALAYSWTVVGSAWVLATSIMHLLMTEEFSAASVSPRATAIYRARPSRRCLVGSLEHHMQKSRVERADTWQRRSWREAG
jgi:hypothetical protein